MKSRQYLFTEQSNAIQHLLALWPGWQAKAHDDVVYVVLATVHGQLVDTPLG